MAISIYDHDTKQGVLSYIGAVLATYERNGYDDSDFIAIVFDAEQNQIKHIEYASTRGWSYNNHARVDATDEVKAQAAEAVRVAYLEALKYGAGCAATDVDAGKTVRVVKGRKVKVGTEGEVLWVRDNPFDTYNKKVCIQVGDEKHYTYEDNLVVVDPENYIPSFEELEAKAEAYAVSCLCNENWRSVDWSCVAAAGVKI